MKLSFDNYVLAIWAYRFMRINEPTMDDDSIAW